MPPAGRRAPRYRGTRGHGRGAQVRRTRRLSVLVQRLCTLHRALVPAEGARWHRLVASMACRRLGCRPLRRRCCFVAVGTRGSRCVGRRGTVLARREGIVVRVTRSRPRRGLLGRVAFMCGRTRACVGRWLLGRVAFVCDRMRACVGRRLFGRLAFLGGRARACVRRRLSGRLGSMSDRARAMMGRRLLGRMAFMCDRTRACVGRRLLGRLAFVCKRPRARVGWQWIECRELYAA